MDSENPEEKKKIDIPLDTYESRWRESFRLNYLIDNKPLPPKKIK
jgi:hypothetical protein